MKTKNIIEAETKDSPQSFLFLVLAVRDKKTNEQKI